MTVSTLNAGVGQRPATLAWAVVLIVAGAALNIASLPVQPDDGPPMAVLVPVTLVFSTVWLVSAWGLWQGAKWAAIVGFVVTAVNGLLTVPGIVFAEELWINIACVIGVAHGVAVCWLLVVRSTREALR